MRYLMFGVLFSLPWWGLYGCVRSVWWRCCVSTVQLSQLHFLRSYVRLVPSQLCSALSCSDCIRDTLNNILFPNWARRGMKFSSVKPVGIVYIDNIKPCSAPGECPGGRYLAHGASWSYEPSQDLGVAVKIFPDMWRTSDYELGTLQTLKHSQSHHYYRIFTSKCSPDTSAFLHLSSR